MNNKTIKKKGFGAWLKWWNACLASAKPWIQSQVLPKKKNLYAYLSKSQIRYLELSMLHACDPAPRKWMQEDHKFKFSLGNRKFVTRLRSEMLPQPNKTTQKCYVLVSFSKWENRGLKWWNAIFKLTQVTIKEGLESISRFLFFPLYLIASDFFKLIVRSCSVNSRDVFKSKY
jgi:hypothetical protein